MKGVKGEPSMILRSNIPLLLGVFLLSAPPAFQARAEDGQKLHPSQEQQTELNRMEDKEITDWLIQERARRATGNPGKIASDDLMLASVERAMAQRMKADTAATQPDPAHIRQALENTPIVDITGQDLKNTMLESTLILAAVTGRYMGAWPTGSSNLTYVAGSESVRRIVANGLDKALQSKGLGAPTSEHDVAIRLTLPDLTSAIQVVLKHDDLAAARMEAR